MKVIDLLNKIANGEEVPEKIEYNGITYELEIYSDWQYYIDRVNSTALLERINSVANLNCKIKIIEEDKKLEKIEMQGFSLFDVADKVNEIIDVVNKLKEGK